MVKRMFSQAVIDVQGSDTAFSLYPSNFDSLTDSFKQENDKKELYIWITTFCINRIHQLRGKNDKYKYLRVEVDSGGCSGFQYNIEMCDIIKDTDIQFQHDGVTIVVDEITLDMIKGSTIHYKDEMIRSAFEVLDNPNSEQNCSCGTSFAPKGNSIF